MGSETHRRRRKEKKEVNGTAVLAKLDFSLVRFVFQSGEPLGKPSPACWCQHSVFACVVFCLFFLHTFA